MNHNLKKVIGLLLVAVALIGCIFVISYISDDSNTNRPSEEPDNTTNGTAFRFKPLEIIEKILGGNNYKSDNISNDGLYELKVNTSYVNNYVNSEDYKTISNVINIGAQDFATIDKYNLKYLDIYSIILTNDLSKDNMPYSITFRYRYIIECSKSNSTFNYYTYTDNTATRVKGYKANVNVTGLDVDLMIDTKTDKYIDVFDIVPNGLGSSVNMYSESFKLASIDFKKEATGFSYFILEDGSKYELTKMYNDPVERLTFFAKDIYPNMCYQDFFTYKEYNSADIEDYIRTDYSNRENNILRIINNDFDKMQGKKFGFDPYLEKYDNPINPLRRTYEENIEKGFELKFKSTINPIILYHCAVNLKKDESKQLEFILQFTLDGEALLSGDDDNLIKFCDLFYLKDNEYEYIFSANKKSITYYNKHDNSSLASFATQLSSSDIQVSDGSVYNHLSINYGGAYIINPYSIGDAIGNNTPAIAFKGVNVKDYATTTSSLDVGTFSMPASNVSTYTRLPDIDDWNKADNDDKNTNKLICQRIYDEGSSHSINLFELILTKY